MQKGARSTEIAEQLINQSDILCVFGMSFGATDRYWWKQLCGWLTQNAERRLILFDYNSNVKPTSNVAVNRRQEQAVLKTFKEAANVTEEVWNSIVEKVYVKEKPGLFDFSKTINIEHQKDDTHNN